MTTATLANDRPAYDEYRSMAATRAAKAADFARLILDATGPYLPSAPSELAVLDVGCGYGHTAVELSRHCRHVVGIDSSASLIAEASRLAKQHRIGNVEFRRQSIYDCSDRNRFDLVILDNVLEHLPDQARAFQVIDDGLRPGGVLFILVPNKLWPIEVHYDLPFLSYLPLRLANCYLRITGRGNDYRDASYAPTYFSLNRLLRARPGWTFHYVLPSDVSLATHGDSWLYRVGVAAIRRHPWLWAISKALMVVSVKEAKANAT